MSPYFDDAYFDPTYFDTGTASTGGKVARGQVRPAEPQKLAEDEDDLLMVRLL